MAALNRLRIGETAYSAHRERLTRLVRALARTEGLCVLGAGNCYDLDLPVLVRELGPTALVDIDGQALQGAIGRLPPETARQTSAHGGIDLGGALDRLEDWGDRLPPAAEVEALAEKTAAAVAGSLGRTFDVVLSACVLTQIYVPFQENLVLRPEEWQRLFEALGTVHLAIMAALLRPGGTGVLATDVASSRSAPAAFAAVATDGLPEENARRVAEHLASQAGPFSPDPQALLALGKRPFFADRVERGRLTEPWLWDAEGTQALVYALIFNRPDPEET